MADRTFHHYTGILVGQYRRERGITQTALACALEVGPSALCQWERGERPFPPERIAAAAAVLEVPVESLVLDIAADGGARRVTLRPPYPLGATLEQAASLGRHEWDIHQSLRARLPRNEYRLLAEAYPRDTKHELVVVMKTAVHWCRVVLTTPGGSGIEVHTMHDLDDTPADHLLQPALVWEAGDEEILMFGQLKVNVPSYKPIRPDFVVRYRKKREPGYWLAVEIDDRWSHDGKEYRDNERALKFALPVLRYENPFVLKPWFFERFLEDIRKVAPEAARRRLQQLQRARRFDKERQEQAALRRAAA